MRSHLPLLLLALGLGACGDQLTSVPEANTSTSNAPALIGNPSARTNLTSSSPVWSRQVVGEAPTGEMYAVFVPASWNGDVVYYAHGIVDAALPIALPTGDGFPAVRDALGGLGYAVAYSSFTENGWAVKDGAQRTHQLRDVVTREVGHPRRSFLVGTSMGGLIAENLSEKYAKQYDGTLAMCAPLGGSIEEVNYIANVRVLFDVFYPGVLPGDVVNVPAGLDLYTQVLGPAQVAVMANPNGLGAIARIKQTPLAGNDGPEIAGSLLYALAYDVRGIDDFLGRTHGHNLFDNSSVVYDEIFPGLLPPQVLAYVNAAAGRFAATPDALNYLEKYYVPSGRVITPTVTLHTTRDPLVPFFHEASFANRAATAGASGNVLQRSVDRYGHCAFTTDEMMNAFQALTSWVNSGQRPTN
jgi:pimeloyl-ACP methyl ester carboxylesterase